MLCFLLCLAFGTACTTVAADLDTTTTLYREARYELVQRWMSALAAECSAMTDGERLRYHYLSGMSAYRLGQPTEALHHLLLAAVLAEHAQHALDAVDQTLMVRTLEELQRASLRGKG